MAFTTLMLFQLFNVFNARSDTTSAFTRLLTNRWLWAALGLSLALHVLVIYTPFLQQAFSTTGLSVRDWLLCLVVASSVLWIRELNKAVARAMSPDRSTRSIERLRACRAQRRPFRQRAERRAQCLSPASGTFNLGRHLMP